MSSKLQKLPGLSFACDVHDISSVSYGFGFILITLYSERGNRLNRFEIPPQVDSQEMVNTILQFVNKAREESVSTSIYR